VTILVVSIKQNIYFKIEMLAGKKLDFIPQFQISKNSICTIFKYFLRAL